VATDYDQIVSINIENDESKDVKPVIKIDRDVSGITVMYFKGTTKGGISGSTAV